MYLPLSISIFVGKWAEIGEYNLEFVGFHSPFLNVSRSKKSEV